MLPECQFWSRYFVELAKDFQAIFQAAQLRKKLAVHGLKFAAGIGEFTATPALDEEFDAQCVCEFFHLNRYSLLCEVQLMSSASKTAVMRNSFEHGELG